MLSQRAPESHPRPNTRQVPEQSHQPTCAGAAVQAVRLIPGEWVIAVAAVVLPTPRQVAGT